MLAHCTKCRGERSATPSYPHLAHPSEFAEPLVAMPCKKRQSEELSVTLFELNEKNSPRSQPTGTRACTEGRAMFFGAGCTSATAGGFARTSRSSTWPIFSTSWRSTRRKVVLPAFSGKAAAPRSATVTRSPGRGAATRAIRRRATSSSQPAQRRRPPDLHLPHRNRPAPEQLISQLERPAPRPALRSHLAASEHRPAPSPVGEAAPPDAPSFPWQRLKTCQQLQLMPGSNT